MPVSDAIKGIGGLSSATETLSVVRVVDIILDETHPEFINLGGWDSLGTIFYIGVNDQKNKFLVYLFPENPNIEQVYNNIGLKTNTAFETKARWIARIAKSEYKSIEYKTTEKINNINKLGGTI